jgi:hypothetical protein
VPLACAVGADSSTTGGAAAAGAGVAAEVFSLRVRYVAREGRVLLVAPPQGAAAAAPHGASSEGSILSLSRLEMAAAACGGCPPAEVEVWAVSTAAEPVRVAGLRTRCDGERKGVGGAGAEIEEGKEQESK